MIDYQEYQRMLQSQANSQLKMQQQLDALENMIRPKMTREALSRYGTLKSAHPEKAVQLLAVLAQNINKFEVINDFQLRELLIQMSPDKKEFKISKS